VRAGYRESPCDSIIGWPNGKNLVCAGVTLDDDPHATAMQVLPGFKLHAVDVVALEHSLDPVGGGGIERWIYDGGIAAIGELTMIAGAAERAGDSDHSLPSAV
tara:strand:+ start:504 stop:812 length:309 start_codon:yes stop_codon:yes gene_type:complete